MIVLSLVLLLYLCHYCLKHNYYIRFLFLCGISFIVIAVAYFDVFREDLQINFIIFFILLSFRVSCHLIDKTHAGTKCIARKVIDPCINFLKSDLILLSIVAFSYLISTPDFVHFSSLTYNDFQSGDFYYTPLSDFSVSILGLFFALIFVYRRAISSTSILLLGAIMAVRSFGFFLAGFRFSFMSIIMFTLFAYLSYRKISLYAFLVSISASFANLKISIRQLRNILTGSLLTISGGYMFVIRTLSRSESFESFNIFNSNPIFLLFYEVASGAAYSMEKLSLSFYDNNIQRIQGSCFIFNESFPPFLPRSIWLGFKLVFGGSTTCSPYSATINTTKFVVYGSNSGTAASLIADFIHYGSFLFVPLLFSFVFGVLYLCILIEVNLDSGLNTTLSRSIFISSFSLISSLLIFWRLDIYASFPLGFFTTFIILALPRVLIGNRF